MNKKKEEQKKVINEFESYMQKHIEEQQKNEQKKNEAQKNEVLSFKAIMD